MKKQKIMLLLEITLFIMIVGTIVSYAAGSNPPSDGVKYNSTTVKAAIDDLYEKVGSAGCNSWTTRNPDTSQIAVGGSRTYYSGIYPSNFTVSCANKTCPTCESQGYGKAIQHEILLPTNQKNIHKLNTTGITIATNKYYDLVIAIVEQDDGGDTNKISITSIFKEIGSSVKPSSSSNRRLKFYQASKVASGTNINIKMTSSSGKAIVIGLKGVTSATDLYSASGISQATAHAGAYEFKSTEKLAICMFNPSIGTEGQYVHMSSVGLSDSSMVKLGGGKNFLGALIKNTTTDDKIHVHLNDSGTTGIKCVKLQ